VQQMLHLVCCSVCFLFVQSYFDDGAVGYFAHLKIPAVTFDQMAELPVTIGSGIEARINPPKGCTDL
jgi:hypothetical protein